MPIYIDWILTAVSSRNVISNRCHLIAIVVYQDLRRLAGAWLHYRDTKELHRRQRHYLELGIPSLCRWNILSRFVNSPQVVWTSLMITGGGLWTTGWIDFAYVFKYFLLNNYFMSINWLSLWTSPTASIVVVLS